MTPTDQQERLLARFNEADKGDMYFLSPQTMAWFDSRIMAAVWTGPDTAYFLLRDHPFPDLPRRFTVHVATFWTDEDNRKCVKVDTVGVPQNNREAAWVMLTRAVSTPMLDGPVQLDPKEDHDGDL